MAVEADLRLHTAQLEVFNAPERFKVIAAGRRWGKTRLSAVYLATAACETRRNGKDLTGTECWYVAPTFDQADDAMWPLFLRIADPLIDKTWEGNERRARMVSGRTVQLKGSDKPHRMRGVALSDLVLDEYADMKPITWSSVLRPTLADVGGRAMFIGTPSPEGRNHFYELFLRAQTTPDWRAWHFRSIDNPFLEPEEIAAVKRDLTEVEFRRELEASFDNAGALVLDPELVVERPDPLEGDVYIAVDPAGYASEDLVQYSQAQVQALDETAIAVVKVDREYGWHVLTIDHGRWGVRETSVRILQAIRRYQPLGLGMERGVLMNAIEPYLTDQMRRLGLSMTVQALSHGGKSKSSRIAWALQGRMEHGRIAFSPGEYLDPLRRQMFDFPLGRRDDLIDALAYIDQIAETAYYDQPVADFFEPMDAEIGY